MNTSEKLYAKHIRTLDFLSSQSIAFWFCRNETANKWFKAMKDYANNVALQATGIPPDPSLCPQPFLPRCSVRPRVFVDYNGCLFLLCDVPLEGTPCYSVGDRISKISFFHKNVYSWFLSRHSSVYWITSEAVWSSPVATGVFGGLSPPQTKLQATPNWNLKLYRSVSNLNEFLSKKSSPPRTDVNPPNWRLSGDCSGLNTNPTAFYIHQYTNWFAKKFVVLRRWCNQRRHEDVGKRICRICQLLVAALAKALRGLLAASEVETALRSLSVVTLLRLCELCCDNGEQFYTPSTYEIYLTFP